MKSDESEDVLGYAVCTQSLEKLTEDICSGLGRLESRRRWLACLNPHSYVVSRTNAPFLMALRTAHWLVPDGAGIVLASRLLGGHIRRRVTGPDIFSTVSALANRRGAFSALFIGSTPQTLAEIRNRYAAEFNNAAPIAVHSPPFKAKFGGDDVAQIRDLVNHHSPDLLWIGLSAPKQELLLSDLHNSADYGFAAAIGAEFDFYAGTVRRAPKLFKNCGLEWLPRLAQEPMRLWHRTLISSPLFVRDVVLAALARRIRRGPTP